jgi:hypothetical protein
MTRTSEIKYPHIHVPLIGEDGNAFAILGRVKRALRSAKVPDETINQFIKQATSGDYNHLLTTVTEWVNINDPAE